MSPIQEMNLMNAATGDIPLSATSYSGSYLDMYTHDIMGTLFRNQSIRKAAAAAKGPGARGFRGESLDVSGGEGVIDELRQRKLDKHQLIINSFYNSMHEGMWEGARALALEFHDEIPGLLEIYRTEYEKANVENIKFIINTFYNNIREGLWDGAKIIAERFKYEVPGLREAYKLEQEKAEKKAVQEQESLVAEKQNSAQRTLLETYGNKIFVGSQQTSMQAFMGNDIRSVGQTPASRKAYMEQVEKSGLTSVTGLLDVHDVNYLVLYGCVIAAMLQQMLDAAGAKITVAQFEALMNDLLNNPAVMKTKITQNGVSEYIPYSRKEHIPHSYRIKDGTPSKDTSDKDVDVERKALADFYKERLTAMGIDVSKIRYIQGENISDYLKDYDIYASIRSNARGHDYGAYIPKNTKYTGLKDYYESSPQNFKDPLDWKSSNLVNAKQETDAKIKGFFIKESD